MFGILLDCTYLFECLKSCYCFVLEEEYYKKNMSICSIIEILKSAFLPERSKGFDSSSNVFVLVGSNPTECKEPFTLRHHEDTFYVDFFGTRTQINARYLSLLLTTYFTEIGTRVDRQIRKDGEIVLLLPNLLYPCYLFYY